MTADFLIDTNILVYAYDRSEYAKQSRAVAILRQMPISGAGALSTQVLAEFYNAVTRKLKEKLTPAEAYERLQNLEQSWPIINITGPIILEAARGVQQYQLSFWDALIWATAKLNQIPVILSEDFNVGSLIEGIRFVNPLVDEFDLAAWIGI
jgi:predicted nucleic acid-binding protein